MKINETLEMVTNDYHKKIEAVLNVDIDNMGVVIPSDEQLEKLEAYAYLNYKFRLLYNDCCDMLSEDNKCDVMYPFGILETGFGIELDLEKIENKIK